MTKSLTLAIAMLVAGVTHAEKKTASAPTVKLEFEDDAVDGEIARAGDSVVGGAVHRRGRMLITVRAHFIAELLRSAEDR